MTNIIHSDFFDPGTQEKLVARKVENQRRPDVSADYVSVIVGGKEVKHKLTKHFYAYKRVYFYGKSSPRVKLGLPGGDYIFYDIVHERIQRIVAGVWYLSDARKVALWLEGAARELGDLSAGKRSHIQNLLRAYFKTIELDKFAEPLKIVSCDWIRKELENRK